MEKSVNGGLLKTVMQRCKGVVLLQLDSYARLD